MDESARVDAPTMYEHLVNQPAGYAVSDCCRILDVLGILIWQTTVSTNTGGIELTDRDGEGIMKLLEMVAARLEKAVGLP